MTYRGRVRKGVVVFDDPVSIDDGTAVNIELLPRKASTPDRGSPQAIRRCDARWVGEPSELDDLLAEVQRLRHADLTSVDDS